MVLKVKQLVSLLSFHAVWVGRICMGDDLLAGPCMLLKTHKITPGKTGYPHPNNHNKKQTQRTHKEAPPTAPYSTTWRGKTTIQSNMDGPARRSSPMQIRPTQTAWNDNSETSCCNMWEGEGVKSDFRNMA